MITRLGRRFAMKQFLVAALLSLLAMTITGADGTKAAPAPGKLQIYWIDVEGGASTLFVSPTGESLLFDTGYGGNGDRDAKRIYAAAQHAGLKKIDHLIISHWHAYHEGGLEALSHLIPISHF